MPRLLKEERELNAKKILCLNYKQEILRLIEVAKSDCSQHNWEKLDLVLDLIHEKVSNSVMVV
jgi:hypothetical protein